MQKKSSPFVKIEYLDKPAIMKAIEYLVKELSQNHPEIERISLFGSFARDEAVPGSDVDILIVLTDSNLPFKDRMMKYMPSSFPVGIDVFPYTRSEIEAMLGQGNYFLRIAEQDSILLFTR
jgi:predicted nucleotidyltransferase